MAVGRTLSRAERLLRSRLIVGSGTGLVLIVALIALVPGESARLALVLLGVAWAVPLLTLGLLRQVLHRTRSEIAGGQSRLISQIQDLHAAHDKLAQELIHTVERFERDEDQRRSDAEPERRRLDEDLQAIRADLRQFQQVIESRRDQIDNGVVAPVPSGTDQHALAGDLVRTSTSVTILYAGVGTVDFCAQLDRRDSVVVVDLNQRPAPTTVGPTEVDSLLVVAGTVADLRRMAGAMESLPQARRLLVTVLRSARDLPLPAVALPQDDEVASFHLLRGGDGWTADLVLLRRRPAEAYVRSVARLGRIKPSGVGRGDDATDILLVNPVGFRIDPTEGIAALAHGDGDDLRIVAGDHTVLRLSAGARLTEADIARLRSFRGLAVDCGPPSPGQVGDGGARPAWAAMLTGLAAAGIPLCATSLPAGVRQSLDPRLAHLIASAAPETLDDPLAREEHSVRLRRVGLKSPNGSLNLPAASPALSVIMCTRRPDMIAFAFEQLKSQRGVDFEVVLGLHGDWPDVASVTQRAESELAGCSVVHIPAKVRFGEALNRIAAIASGPVLLKMDDDDWYGPDFLSDLLLARNYSGSDIVGCAAEFVFLEELNITVRRAWRTEVFGHTVSGGALMIDRATFQAVDGFRSLETPGPEDALIQDDVRDAGGSSYRSQGLSYVLRRRPSGHTWQESSDYFLESAVQTWPGLYLPTLFRAE
jgi:hypothetical protein